MIWHVLGYATLAAQGFGSVFLLRWLTIASHESRSWMRKLPVPKAAGRVSLSSGADFVGYI